MKQTILLVFLSFCLFLTGGYPASAPAGSGPRMVIEESRVDFGEVNQWDLLTYTFVVANQGDDVLRIERVSPD